MLFLIDGYNATMRDRSTQGHSKESQRELLVGRLVAHGRRLLGSGEIVVVFDARGTFTSSGERAGSVAVVYAPDADDEIARRAQRARGQVTVITDDLRLRARISQDVGRHIAYRDTESLFGEDTPRAQAAAASSRDGVLSGTDALPADERAAITAELEREWLEGGS